MRRTGEADRMRGEKSREAALEDLYQGLSTLARRARDLGDDLHPGLSLVAYSLLVQIDLTSEARAADLAAHFGLDKSTVSRQLEQLIAAGLLRREGERPGRRGYGLVLTDAGKQLLAEAAQAVKDCLAGWLADWDDGDVAGFGQLVGRFNASTNRAETGFGPAS
jgi:DNA-binding MarR family transcriptional regulator